MSDDPVTATMANNLNGEGRTGAIGGYVCYLREGAPDNTANTWCGFGYSEKAALLNACFWSNQYPWIRVVPWGKAPKSIQIIIGERGKDK